MGLQWKGWELFSKTDKEAVTKKKPMDTTPKIDYDKCNSLRDNAELERKRQERLLSMQRQYNQQTSPYQVTSPSGVATNIPGQGHNILSGSHTFGGPQQWNSQPATYTTAIRFEDMTDSEQAQLMVTQISRLGIREVGPTTLSIVQKMLKNGLIERVSISTKKQPKKKLDL